jgi:hypothetical protein
MNYNYLSKPKMHEETGTVLDSLQIFSLAGFSVPQLDFSYLLPHSILLCVMWCVENSIFYLWKANDVWVML